MPSGLFDRKIAIRKIAFSCALWLTRPTSPPAGGESPEPQRNPVCTLSLMLFCRSRSQAPGPGHCPPAWGRRDVAVNGPESTFTLEAAAEHALAVSSCY